MNVSVGTPGATRLVVLVILPFPRIERVIPAIRSTIITAITTTKMTGVGSIVYLRFQV